LIFVTERKPNKDELEDLIFAWKIVKRISSNGIVVAKNKVSLGIGAGQMSRIDSVKIALEKSGGNTKNAVLASDGFFPFRDSIDLSAKFGITAIIQPGGSIRDKEVIQAANEHNIAMVFTGIRAFRH
jgi:AICAR transformylase/IMP cyclohydrolase PurH (only IMP cyclohydrolase domain in Aful)